MKYASLALLALTVGCTATIVDGQYGCPDGRCPSGLSCQSDGRCHYGSVGDGSTGTCGGSTMGMCPSGQECVIGAWSMGMPSLGCAAGPAANNHGHLCTPGNMHDCTAPDACIDAGGGVGECMRPCGPGTNCGFGEQCVTPRFSTATGAHVCAASCPPACPGTGTLLSCSGSGFCLPENW